jgi:predicted PurR-regulated permease PerM
MEILAMLIGILALIMGICSLACWIMVIVAAFKNEQSPLMGILCIVLCGLGAFIIGWIKHDEWRIKNVMMA